MNRVYENFKRFSLLFFSLFARLFGKANKTEKNRAIKSSNNFCRIWKRCRAVQNSQLSIDETCVDAELKIVFDKVHYNLFDSFWAICQIAVLGTGVKPIHLSGRKNKNLRSAVGFVFWKK